MAPCPLECRVSLVDADPHATDRLCAGPRANSRAPLLCVLGRCSLWARGVTRITAAVVASVRRPLLSHLFDRFHRTTTRCEPREALGLHTKVDHVAARRLCAAGCSSTTTAALVDLAAGHIRARLLGSRPRPSPPGTADIALAASRSATSPTKDRCPRTTAARSTSITHARQRLES